MTGYVKTAALAAALRVSRKELMKRARAEGWPCIGQKGGLLFLENRLPEGARLALAEQAALEQRAREPEGGGDCGLSRLTDRRGKPRGCGTRWCTNTIRAG